MVIVLNQVVGPPFLSWRSSWPGSPRADIEVFDGCQGCHHFWPGGPVPGHQPAVDLHEWQVKVICFDPTLQSGMDTPDVPIECVNPHLDIEKMQQLGVDKADALVAILHERRDYKI